MRGIDGFSDWFETLKRQVEGSAAMISVIGPDWLDATDKDGKRRLDNPKDFVRFEIAEALRHKIPVLPVLLDGATMPPLNRLPDDMHGMLRLHGMELLVKRFPEDAAAISEMLRKILGEPSRKNAPFWKAAAIAAASLALGVTAGPYLLTNAGFQIPFVAPLTPEDIAVRLRAAEAGRDRALEMVATAKREVSKQAAEMKRLADALQAEREKGQSLNGKLSALQAQFDGQKTIASRAQARADELALQLSAKESEIAELRFKLGDARRDDIAKPKMAQIEDYKLEVPQSGECPVDRVKESLGERYKNGNGFGYSFYKDDTLKAQSLSTEGGVTLDNQPALLEQVRLLVRNTKQYTVLVTYSGDRAKRERWFCGWLPWNALVGSRNKLDGFEKSFTDERFGEGEALWGYGWRPRFLTVGELVPGAPASNLLFAKSLIQTANTDAVAGGQPAITGTSQKNRDYVVKVYDKPGGTAVGDFKMFNVFNIIDTEKRGDEKFFLLAASHDRALGWVREKDQLLWPSRMAVFWAGTGKGIIYPNAYEYYKKGTVFAQEPQNVRALLPQDRNVTRFPVLGPSGKNASGSLPDYFEIAFIGVNPKVQGPAVSINGFAPTRVDGVEVFNYWVALDPDSFHALRGAMDSLCPKIVQTASDKAIEEAMGEMVRGGSGDRMQEGETFQQFFVRKLYIPALALNSEFMKYTPQSLLAHLRNGSHEVSLKTQRKVCRFAAQLGEMTNDEKTEPQNWVWDNDKMIFQSQRRSKYVWMVRSEFGLPLYYVPLEYFP